MAIVPWRILPQRPATATRLTSVVTFASSPGSRRPSTGIAHRPRPITCPRPRVASRVKFLQDTTPRGFDHRVLFKFIGCYMKIKEVFAYLCVSDADAAIDFYGHAFGAIEKFRLTEPSGRIGHAELDF